MPKPASRFESCSLCPSTSHKMLVGDPMPWPSLKVLLFGRRARTRPFKDRCQKLWCLRTSRRGIRHCATKA